MEALVRKAGAEFNVIIIQINGDDVSTQSIHNFHVGKMRIKLRKGRSTKAKEPYSASMQHCGKCSYTFMFIVCPNGVMIFDLINDLSCGKDFSSGDPMNLNFYLVFALIGCFALERFCFRVCA